VFELLILNGSRAGARFTLPDVPMVVGRSTEAHLRIDDPWISNMHALFEQRGEEELWVVDLGSRNGTFVGQKRVKEARIGADTLLAFGRTEVRVEQGGVAAVHAEEPTRTPIQMESISTTMRTERPTDRSAKPAPRTDAEAPARPRRPEDA
jgi:pSer/pThr/pTyr-binding forkhead associated (FHA) protein